jgi:RHS repeat-associated protein
MYTGRRFDGESGLFYYRNRYYHSQIGQFVSRDPIGYQGGDANLYQYVYSLPGCLSDPWGFFGFPARPIPMFPRPYLPPAPTFPRPYVPPNPTYTPPPPGPGGTVFPPGEGDEPAPVGPNPRDFPYSDPAPHPNWRCSETDSDCPRDLLNRLSRLVDANCKEPPPRVCNSVHAWMWFSCADYAEVARENELCARARRRREFTCFRGGDRGHRMQISQFDFHASYCYWMMRRMRCPGFDGPGVFNPFDPLPI